MSDYVKIIQDQRKAFEEMMAEEVVRRAPVEHIDLFSPCAQVVIGIRRCGKSVLCRMALKARNDIRCGYVNFDDEKLANVSADNLNDILEAVYVVYGEIQVLFLDEVQNAPSWELFVNRLLRQGLHLLVTGSNSRLLSSELATHLTGRHIPTELFPFSFGEYLKFLGRGEPADTEARALVRRDYEHYFDCGGLPETFRMADTRGYIATLYDSILYKDILKRHGIRGIGTFADMARVVMESFAQEISYRNIAARLGVSNVRTVQNYVVYMRDAYLIQTLNRYSAHAHERAQVGKVYAIDPGFITHFTGVSEGDESRGRRQENIVFLQLKALRVMQDFEIYYYRDREHEIDFLLRRHGRAIRLIQVAYAISSPKTRKRELSALFAVGEKLKCDDLVLVTDHEDGTETDGRRTVKIVNIVYWLLEEGKAQ